MPEPSALEKKSDWDFCLRGVAEMEEAVKPALLALFLFLVIPRIMDDRNGSPSVFEPAELIRF